MSSDEGGFGLLAKERIRRTEFPRAEPALIQAFLELPDMAGLVARAMDRIGITGSVPAHLLAPLSAGRRVVGPAVTVRNAPSRCAPFHGWESGALSRLGEREAYFVARPGDVIVIDSGGRLEASNLGPNSAALALSKGIVAAIVDGLVTGPAGIREHGFPVWCRGATTLTGHHRVETVEINGTIACASAQVAPGDLVVADDSGITFVPAERAGDVLTASQRLAEKGRALAAAVAEKASASQIRERFRTLLSG